MAEKEETVIISVKIPRAVYDYVKKYIDFEGVREEEFWREEILMDIEGLADHFGATWGQEFEKTLQKYRDC